MAESFPLHWHDLGIYWDWLTFIGKQRIRQKSSFASTRAWSAHGSHIVGVAAEMVVSLTYGKRMNAALNMGDGGADFVDVAPELRGRLDVKGVIKDARHWPPVLKHPANEPMRADWYALVSVDLERKRGALIGVVPAKVLAAADVRDFGYGPQKSLEAAQVRRWFYDYMQRNRPMQVCPTCGFPVGEKFLGRAVT